MARSSPRNLKSDIKHLSNMGERSTSESMRVATLMLYALTMFFALIYFVICGTRETTSDGSGTTAVGADAMREKPFAYVAVIAGASLILFCLEFYAGLNSLMKLVRLACVAIVIIFVALSINPTLALADESQSNGDRAIEYAFAALTLGFAGLAALLNSLEVFRNSGY